MSVPQLIYNNILTRKTNRSINICICKYNSTEEATITKPFEKTA